MTSSKNTISKQDLYALCLSLPGAEEFVMPPPALVRVFRHQRNGKWFAFVHTLQGKLCVTLKLIPMEGLALRTQYRGVGPGWHMNKVHWNTIEVCSDVPRDELVRMLQSSHELTGLRR